MATQIQAIEHALFWANRNGNKVKIYRHFKTTDKSISILVGVDGDYGNFFELPINFVGDIDKYICQSKKEKALQNIEYYQQQIKNESEQLTNPCDGEEL